MTTYQPDTDILVVGAGFAGLCLGYHFKKAGLERFTIVEKASDVGGTWRDNHYPGAACDVQSHLYSFSFYPKPDWSRFYAGWAEIKAYMQECARAFGLAPHLRFNTEVTGARWDESTQCWHVRLGDQGEMSARYFILATGPLHHPNTPDIPGLKDFRGPVVHTARWDDALDLKGKRVAVIGTGASAIQLVPEVAKVAGHLHVLQRTPAWVVRRPDRAYSEAEKARFRRYPLLRKLHRARLYWQNEGRFLPMHHPVLSSVVKALVRWDIRHKVRDRLTARKLTPEYAIGCKRVLLSNDWYPTFNRPNVSLHTEGIEQVEADGIRLKNGERLEADVLVTATGFVVDPRKYLMDVPIIGRSGRDIKAVWADLPHAYKGITVPDFPNLFQMTGPNTGLGHSSIIFMIECQTRYILSALKAAEQQRLPVIEVREDVEAAYNARIQKQLSKRIWASGCSSWYLDEKGRNFTLWPGTTTAYYLATRKIRLADYHWRPLHAAVPEPEAVHA
ncbi:MAG: NAD(P)/FAD-dependent oxidoreductase [Gammaproteobacteria bacterium]|nr:MAG: NAD(P)/FAD-dependent oxidoreductase [Gammaproteobacteria bacterium]